MSVKKRINHKTHKKSKSRKIKRRRLSRKIKRRRLIGGVKEDCLTLNNYKKKLADTEKKLDEIVQHMGPVSAYDMYGNTTSEREHIETYKNKIDNLNKLKNCKDEKNILPSDKDDRIKNCKSCNS